MNSLWPVLGVPRGSRAVSNFSRTVKSDYCFCVWQMRLNPFFFFFNSAPAKTFYETKLVCNFILNLCANFQNDQTVFCKPGAIIVSAVSHYETLILSNRA